MSLFEPTEQEFRAIYVLQKAIDDRFNAQRLISAPTEEQMRERSDAQKRYDVQTPSLDGRITGRPRTCGYDTFQYDGLGVPYGPYCH